MDQGFQDVNGCHLHLPDLHSTVVFPSIADALFASLVVKYSEILGHEVLTLFDEILQLFRREDFNTSQFTMRRALDVFVLPWLIVCSR